MIEQLSLGVSLKCLQADMLKQRIAGLKLLSLIFKYVQQQSSSIEEQSYEISQKDFCLWMKKH